MHLDLPDDAPPGSPLAPPSGRWWRQLNRYHWFVFVVASLAWILDCMDQQLFTVSRDAAITELLGPLATAADVKEHAGYATSIFLIGWALGGLGFGIMGDRAGRVQTLKTTILLYSIFTGFSAFSLNVWDFALYRFLTGLGVGGVFAVAVTLVAETVPDQSRPYALGMLQASSALGNVAAALLSMWLGSLQQRGSFDQLYLLGMGPVKPWRLMFLVGVLPAILVVIIQGRLKEPERWRAAIAEGGTRKAGSFAELFGHPRWRRHALFGLLLAFSGVVGLWAIGFFSPDLVRGVLKRTFTAEGEQLGLTGHDLDRYVAGQQTFWAGVTSLMFNLGAFAGISAFAWVTAWTGRRLAFAIALVAAAAVTALEFATLNHYSDLFWMIPLVGFCQLALFGGYAIYFPELFPTRLRATGTSFCYNVGRLVAAVGPAALGLLTKHVFTEKNGFGTEGFRWAGVAMCSVFLLGLLALPFLPETKGQPLPE
jgi:MFS family permease